MLACVRESHNHILGTTLENTSVASLIHIFLERNKLCFCYNTLLMDIFASGLLSAWVYAHLIAKS